MKLRILMALLCGFFLLGRTPAVMAEEGIAVGLGAAYTVIGGDLTKIDPGAGLMVLIDYRFDVPPHLKVGDEQYSLQLSYLVSQHRTQSFSTNVDSIYSIINLDLKFSFLTSQPAQPYFLIGVGYHTLKIPDGAINLATSEILDLKLYGVGFNFGVGLDYYLTPSSSIGAGLVYRQVQFNEAAVKGTRDMLYDSPHGDNFGPVLTGVYHF